MPRAVYVFHTQASSGSAVDDPGSGDDDPGGGNTYDLGSFGALATLNDGVAERPVQDEPLANIQAPD